jgi:predicted DNA binding CopG/RHH family protein
MKPKTSRRKPVGRVRKAKQEVLDYDTTDATSFLDLSKQVQLEDLGLKLPKQPTTQVISIRLPSDLLNEIKAFSSQRDIPYQAIIKLFLSDAIAERKKRAA